MEVDKVRKKKKAQMKNLISSPARYISMAVNACFCIYAMNTEILSTCLYISLENTKVSNSGYPSNID